MSEIVAFIIGSSAGFLLCSIFAVGSYQKGLEDGLKRKQNIDWQEVGDENT